MEHRLDTVIVTGALTQGNFRHSLITSKQHPANYVALLRHLRLALALPEVANLRSHQKVLLRQKQDLY